MAKKIRPENDIEKLTNQQIILLTFLVAIISAITASIAVIRFYERNPNIVTRIINNKETVYETIENTPNVSIDKTVVIKESDLIANAVSKNSRFIYDVILKGNNEEKIITTAFKKNGKIFTKKFEIKEGEKVFINSLEVKKFDEIDNIMVFKEIGEEKILEISSEIGIMKLGSTVINIFSKTQIEKVLISEKINENKFLLDFEDGRLNKDNISLAVGLSGKVFGITLDDYIYSFDYLTKEEG